MQIYANKLSQHLKQTLAKVYLVAGDEILLQNEACDEIRQACAKSGFVDRERYNFETGFDWHGWQDSCNAMSLFASQRLIELRLPSSKIGTVGSEAITRFCNNPPQDTVLLIIAARIEGSPKWVKAVSKDGVYIPIYPLDHEQLPNWLKRRAKQQQLTLAHDAAQLLAERVEGNLMAANQELEKLALLVDKKTTLTRSIIGKAVADSARFSAFNCFDHAIDGDALSACRALRHLQEEGTEPAALVAAMAHQLRTLAQLKQFSEQGKMDDGMRALRVQRKRQSAVSHRVQSTSKAEFEQWTKLASQADLMSKSIDKENAWLLIEMVLLGLAGKPMATQHYHI